MNIFKFFKYRWLDGYRVIQRSLNHFWGLLIEQTKDRRLHTRDFRDIPVVITSFNRLDYLREQVNWLERAGTRKIIIIDNASSYPPLVSYLSKSRHEVVYLKQNLGPYAFWKSTLYRRFWNDFYVVTDPDIVPSAECPLDLVQHLHTILTKYKNIRRAGVGLRLDDIPDCFSLKRKVCDWESQFWQHEVEKELYLAAVDTTFAMYRPRTVAGDGKSLRTGFPYVAHHLPWYVNSANPSAEDLFYKATAQAGASWWSEGTNHNIRDTLLAGK